MKVLAVDDSEVIRAIIVDTARMLGYAAEEAASGEAALHMLGNHSSDIGLIILDYNLPGMNGLDCLRRIKTTPRWAAIPVLMVTTQSEGDLMVKAIKAGACNYLAKPFVMEDLATCMLKCLDE